MSVTLIAVCCAAVAGMVMAAGERRLLSRGGFWLLVGLVALGIAAGLFGRFGGFGLGGGSGDGEQKTKSPAAKSPKPPEPADTRPKPPTRPLKITVDDKGYFVDNRKVSLEQVAEMLGRIPEGPGPAVVVTFADDSRPPAEIDLRKLLKERGVSSLWPQ